MTIANQPASGAGLLSMVLALLAACSDVHPATGVDARSVDGAGGNRDLGDATAPRDRSAPDRALADGSTDAPAQSADEVLFERVLAGDLPAVEGLRRIAAAGGWPVAVAGSYLFARLDDGDGPYRLAGDHEGWQGQSMSQEAGLYWIVAQVAQPDGAKYKFIDGQGGFAADPLARRHGYDDFGRYSLVRSTGGHLELYRDLGSAAVSPRAVRVWVPKGPPTHHLYVHDGQNLFDPGAPHGGWQLAAVAGPTTLVVGIDSNDDRMTDYAPEQDHLAGAWVGGGADAYAAFVLQVVRPLIEQHYGKPLRVGVMGSSLGGLVSLHQALRDPQAYDFAASLSGTVGWGSIGASNPTVVDRFASASQKLSVALYLDSGGGAGTGCVDADGDGLEDDDPGSWDNYCENAQLAAVLQDRGYVAEQDFWYWWEQGASHDEAAWRARAFRPLAIFEAL